MSYQFNFGALTVAGATPAPRKGKKFRLAVLGDFSARANRGELGAADAVAARKPLSAEADNLDDLLERLSPKVKLDLPGSGPVELEFTSMQDFHPDALYEKLEIFSQLSSLRSRLKTTSTFAKAAQEMRAIGLGPAPARRMRPTRARGSVIATDAKLSDFARFLGQSTVDEAAAEALDAKGSLHGFLRGIVAPHVSATKDPQQGPMVKAADEAIGAMMREVLHHPDFQTLESLWRTLAFLATRLETDETLQVVLLDMSAEEFAADLSAADDLRNTALYRLLVEDPSEDPRAGLFSAIVGCYVFEQTPPHADLLARMAKLAVAAQAPFIASVPAGTLDTKPEDLHPLTRDAWDALRALPEAGYLALGLPRFMLRLPYGQGTEPIDAFNFEEFTPQGGMRTFLWANPAAVVGLLLAETFRKQGDAMRLGSIAGIGELPYYCYEDADGDQTALPCTERYITERTMTSIAGQGFLPLLAVKNAPEVRVGLFRAVSGGLLGGWWAGAPPALSAPAQPVAADAEPMGEAVADVDASAEPVVADAPPEEAAPAEATAEEAPASDPELDALLASLSTPAEEPAPAAASEEEIDPELAKLLAELG